MDYQLRVFDEPRDLSRVVALYNTVFGPLRPYYSWPISVERFRDKVLAHWEFRKEGFWLAWQGDELVGFILAGFRDTPLLPNDPLTPDRSPVFISAVAVDGRHRRRGIGRALCEKVVAFARANGRTRVKVSANPQAPMSFFISVQDDWAEARAFFPDVGFGFAGLHQNMARSIIGFEPDEPVRRKIAELTAAGHECRVYEDRDYAALVSLLDENGWPYWNLDMLSKVGRWTKTRPFMETCFLDCSTEQILGPDEIGVVVKDGRMLSFCAQTINPSTGKAYLGPMLTAKHARNRGLGTVSLQVSLQLAARKGAVVCDLWTDTDGAITHYYRKSGFEHVLDWFDYEMPLGEP